MTRNLQNWKTFRPGNNLKINIIRVTRAGGRRTSPRSISVFAVASKSELNIISDHRLPKTAPRTPLEEANVSQECNDSIAVRRG